ncbi:MAG TPA: hypothetical protein VEJ63_00285 [Planctomycetota bacterium]|nr:hypothetical protein [Planctomycetota bacterium]
MSDSLHDKITALCRDALDQSAAAPEALRAPVATALSALNDPRWRVLFSGLCSAGKSSFVCSLWGDSELLPTAVRDCTQTNTMARKPAAGERDREIRLSYLSREKAVDFASRDLACYRLTELLRERETTILGLLDELPAEERLRKTVELVRKLFRDHPDQLVLHEPLTEELEKLEQFLAFIDSSEYRAGETIAADWKDRRELLMGRRHPDGRTFDTGKLLALRHVEMVRDTSAWPSAEETPQLIDSPWIPTFHNARRADLIIEQARESDILVIVALPQKFELEPWVRQFYRTHPELAARTVVVFNQIDTIDTSSLFSREGFYAAFEENRERLIKDGIRVENLLLACARLPFLEGLRPDPQISERIERLKKVLQRVAKAADGRPENDFVRKLRRAADPSDAGVKTLRQHLLQMSKGSIKRARMEQALKALDELLGHMGESASALRSRAMGLEMSLKLAK